MNTAVILGAGFSSVAGLPLTRNLFETDGVLPRAQSLAAQKNHREVHKAYSIWLKSHASINPEEWLLELYRQKDNPFQETAQQTTWSKALRFALARLIDLPRGKNSHYYFGICTAKCHPIHQRFWRRIEDDFGSKV